MIRIHSIMGLIAALMLPVVASAHAHLVSATPAPKSVVTQAPPEVSLRFTEALEGKFSTIQVLDSGGQPVSAGAPVLDPNDPKHLTVPLKPLSPGAYKVVWKAVSTDTHETEGSFVFDLH